MQTLTKSGTPTKPLAIACLFALLAAPAFAQTNAERTAASRDAGTLTHDCADVSVDYADEPGLTREERIARMDRAFQRSLSRFEECQTDRATNASGGGAGSGGAGGGQGGGDGQGGDGMSGTETAGGEGAGGAESDGAETSTAARDISGPDAPETAPSQAGQSTAAGDMSGDEPTVTAATQPVTGEEPTREDVSGEAAVPDAARDDDVSDNAPGDAPERTAARTQENGKLPEDIPPADNDSALEAQIRKAAIEETDPELKKRLWDEYRRYKGLPVPN